MNEPLFNKATEILNKYGRTPILGSGVRFHSEDMAIKALIEFAKFYDKYGHETEEEKQKDGNNPTMPKCAVCRERTSRCLCFDGFI
jgi:predicted nucleotidyltransferase